MFTPRALLLLIPLCLLVACGDEDPTLSAPPPSFPTPLRERPDERCAEVSCGVGARCEIGPNNNAYCACDEDHLPSNGRCTRIPAPPVFDNLPATATVVLGARSSYTVGASNRYGERIFLSVNNSCGFPATLESSTITWTCPNTTRTCDLQVYASTSSGEEANSALTIKCLPSPPSFTTSPPTTAVHGLVTTYEVGCRTPHNLNLRANIAPDDTCGGSFVNSVPNTIGYRFTPTQAMIQTGCVISILCNDTVNNTNQRGQVRVLPNQPPRFVNLPGLLSVPTSSTRNTFLSTSDPERRPLTLTSGSNCSPSTSISSTNTSLTTRCGTQPETCQITLTLRDEVNTVTATIPLTCAAP